MKEAIGGGWLFTIVIVMVLLFSSYVSLSTNYSRCYNVKDRIVNIIELEGGVSDNAVKKINNYMKSVGYSSSSNRCDVSTSENSKFIKMRTSCSSAATCKTTSGNGNYCVQRISLPNTATGKPNMYYYKVVVFFQLSLPVIGEYFLIRVSGETCQLLGNDATGLFG